MALDERDYMRESTRRIVERDYYELLQRLEHRRRKPATRLRWKLVKTEDFRATERPEP